jgi:hypothetical protein
MMKMDRERDAALGFMTLEELHGRPDFNETMGRPVQMNDTGDRTQRKLWDANVMHYTPNTSEDTPPELEYFGLTWPATPTPEEITNDGYEGLRPVNFDNL